MKFIGALIIIAFLIFFLFGSILAKIIRFFSANAGTQQRTQQGRNNDYSQTSTPQQDNQKKFSKEEGEYVPYEEIKDDE